MRDSSFLIHHSSFSKMVIKKNISLQRYNTFGLPAKATNLIQIHSEQQLKASLKLPYQPVFILGGGSNMLLTKDIEGLVLKNEIRGIKVLKKNKNTVVLKIGGGENWHAFVLWCIQQGYGGVENLSLIPGTVGASPIQNIGAYGVELKDIFLKLDAIEITTGKKRTFTKANCQFGYRDSVFKRTLKGQYFITAIYLQLTHRTHQLNMDYGAIKKILSDRKSKEPTIKAISDAVIHIRSTKLPDPADLGNSGSFFKNPEISKSQFEQLQKRFPNIVFYDLPNNRVKVPAGWLIEQCGWKGKRVGNTGAHAKQALVLVNYGAATGSEIEHLAYDIIDSVQERFGIQLTPEVNII